MTRLPAPRSRAASMDAADYRAQTRRSVAHARRDEDAAQMQVIAWCNRLDHPALAWLHHSANEAHGGARVNGTPTAVFRNARMGVKKGWPDLVLPWRREIARNYWLSGWVAELKIAPNTPDPAQAQWLDHFEAQGWYVRTFTADDAPTLATDVFVDLMRYLDIAERVYALAMR